jgi:hypothetical protein
MINNIRKLLQTDKWYNVSREVEIAKGRYEYVSTFKSFIQQLKRMLNSNTNEEV